ncbi:hypothetical protein RND81_01G079100 [Saponaria officinalis]|uniref:DUF8039 domain-containing protein n=1 Tax=Saponaria officinalis TaxID=3572 RepID=A0AAW1NDU2_SAPOF
MFRSHGDQRKRDKAVESAKKNENHHHLGQNDFNTARQIWIKDGFYPGSTRTEATNGTRCASDVAIDVNRADDWFCAIHSKEKQTGKYVIKKPKNQEVADKLLKLREKQIQGEFIPQGDKDRLYYALGEKEDHPRRARGLGGVNISVKQAFGDSASRKCGTSKKGKSSEEREAIKNELREELRNEMMSILRQSGLKLPDDREISPEHPLINQPQPSLSPSLVKDDTPCRLLLRDPHCGMLYEVAHGKTFPMEDGQPNSIILDHVRVKVCVVLEEFNTLRLPVPIPVYDVYTLSDAVESFVQWPLAYVRLEEPRTPNGLGTEKGPAEIIGSNSQPTRLSATPRKGHGKDFTVESLSLSCRWLNYLVGAMIEGETFDIYFDADLFYFKEEGKTKVHRNDLKQFLESSELSVPIIQIFMRTLRDDLKKAETGPRIGWLCPEATLDTKLLKNGPDAIAYVTEAFLKSDRNKDEFIMAPIYNRQFPSLMLLRMFVASVGLLTCFSFIMYVLLFIVVGQFHYVSYAIANHWMLLVICPQTYTIYEFDPITGKERRELYMKMVVSSALKRYKLSGGHLKVTRREPLWKSVKCPQQTKSVEYGFFVLRFMFDIVKSCTTSNDLEKV